MGLGGKNSVSRCDCLWSFGNIISGMLFCSNWEHVPRNHFQRSFKHRTQSNIGNLSWTCTAALPSKPGVLKTYERSLSLFGRVICCRKMPWIMQKETRDGVREELLRKKSRCGCGGRIWNKIFGSFFPGKESETSLLEIFKFLPKLVYLGFDLTLHCYLNPPDVIRGRHLSTITRSNIHKLQ